MTVADTRGRRSREERSADSRRRILDAAVDCLVADGYAGATTLAIQARAGVSRGRLLHHYPSRDGLLVAAAQHLAATRVAGSGADPAALDTLPTGADRLDRVIELLWQSFHEPVFWAAAELWAAARTNPGLARTLAPAERALGAAVRESIDRLFGPGWVARPHYRNTRDLLFTSMRGVALTYAFDPRPPATDPHLTVWKTTARALLGGT